MLAPLAACIATLEPLQQRVLVRRAGLQGYTGRSRAGVAKSLGLSRTRVARLERRALRTLRREVRSGGCTAPAASASASASAASAPIASAPAVVSALAAPPAAPHDRAAVKAAHAFGGSLLDLPSKVTAASPKAIAAAVSSAARSYGEDHPAQFVLAILVTLLCALLLVRELRRDLRFR